MSDEKDEINVRFNSFTHTCNIGSELTNVAVTERYYPGFAAPQAIGVSCDHIENVRRDAGKCKITGRRCYLLDPVNSVS